MQDPNATSDSLDIVYEELKQRMATQNAQIAALDGKANFGLASASLLTAVVALNAAVSTSQRIGTVRPFSILWLDIADPVSEAGRLTTAAFAVYLAVILFSFLAYRIRPFQDVPDPKELMTKYLDQPREQTKRDLSGTRAVTFLDNEKQVKRKVRWSHLVILGLTVEAVLLMLLTLIQIRL